MILEIRRMPTRRKKEDLKLVCDLLMNLEPMTKSAVWLRMGWMRFSIELMSC